jgi:MtN3 and saliva related transmembrane protein
VDYLNLLGLLAGTLTTLAFLPQLMKVWKTKSTDDISLAMFSVLCIGVLLWIIYGILIRSLPVFLSNLVTFVLAFLILIIKIKHPRSHDE